MNGLLALMHRKCFNLVIEGSYHDDWRNFSYKLVEMSLRDDVSSLKDSIYTYLLYGRTTDFQTITKEEGSAAKEMKLDSSIAFCNGVVLPYRGGSGKGLAGFLERPRSLMFRDGRVFVEKGMLSDAAYLTCVEDCILEKTRQFFKSDQAQDVYNQAMSTPPEMKILA